MKYRKHEWLNTETDVAWYGIQVRHKGKWLHVMENGAALVYPSEDRCDEKLRELRKEHPHAAE